MGVISTLGTPILPAVTQIPWFSTIGPVCGTVAAWLSVPGEGRTVRLEGDALHGSPYLRVKHEQHTALERLGEMQLMQDGVGLVTDFDRDAGAMLRRHHDGVPWRPVLQHGGRHPALDLIVHAHCGTPPLFFYLFDELRGNDALGWRVSGWNLQCIFSTHSVPYSPSQRAQCKRAFAKLTQFGERSFDAERPA